MSNTVNENIRNHPKFAQLVKTRGRYAWTLSVLLLIVFYGFVMLVAFKPTWIGASISPGSMLTIGVLAELLMFIVFWLMTLMYVRRANGEFDQITQSIILDAVKGSKS